METWLLIGLAIVLGIIAFVAWLALPVSWRDGERQDKETEWGPMRKFTQFLTPFRFLPTNSPTGSFR